MNKKNIVIFIISLVLILLAIFIDNYYFHFIFKAKPGSCLILEERYCKTGKIIYIDNEPTYISYTIKNKTPLFSPISNNYSVSKATRSDGSLWDLFTVEKNKDIWYLIFYNGNLNNIKDLGYINKKDVFGFSFKSKNQKKTQILLSIKNVSQNEISGLTLSTNKEELVDVFNNTKKNLFLKK